MVGVYTTEDMRAWRKRSALKLFRT